MATNASDSIKNVSLGSRIKELRKRAGISQQGLADVVGISRAAVSLFEIGTSKPSSETLSKLSDALQVDMAYLLGKKQVPVANETGATNGVAVDLPFISLHSRAALIQTVVNPSDLLRLFIPDEEDVARYADALVIEVAEDQMEPLLHAGDKVIAWPVPKVKWAHVYNQVCLVAFDETVTIKAIRENELPTRGLLTLYAQNTTAGFLSVQQEQIKGIWRVEEFFKRPKIRL